MDLKPWTEQHKKKYIWLYNYIKTLKEGVNENDYINVYKTSLINLIEDNDLWSDVSKETLLFMISRYLHNLGDNKYSKIYQLKALEYLKKNQEKEGENELDDKEKLYYRDHQYFLDIINSVENVNDLSYIEHLKFLILNLSVIQPPLRTSFYTSCRFIRSKKEDDGINNFIFISKRGKVKIEFIVNNDKASNYKAYNIDKNLTVIKVENEDLINLINNSLIKYPRKYLLEFNELPISQGTYLSYLRQITKVSGITQDIMRSSYITWFYKNHHKLNEKEKLSKMMRHSVQTAMKNYNKIIDTTITEKQDSINFLNETIDKLKNEKENLTLKVEAYNLPIESNKIEDLKNYKKKRADMLYNLNKRDCKPREDSLKKYDIKYNNDTKLYY